MFEELPPEAEPLQGQARPIPNGNGQEAGTRCEGCGRFVTPARVTLSERKLWTVVFIDSEKEIIHAR